MKRTVFSLRIFLFIILFTATVSAQNKQTFFTADYKDSTFTQWVEKIEKASSYKFYYNVQQIDTLKVIVKVDSLPLNEILSKIFESTPLKYAIDNKGHVFITEKTNIAVQLPQGFLKNPESNSGKNETFTGRPSDHKSNVNIIATLENKTFEIGKPSTDNAPTATVAGILKDVDSGEPIGGASIVIENSNLGAATDVFGYYSITLPKGQHQLLVRSIGMKDTKRKINLNADGILNIEMQIQVQGLKEVVVESEKARNVRGVQMGQEKLTIKTIKQLPSVFGEADILRAVLTLPGVKTVGEATTGFNVRGGSVDQNLILYNDATIYNPSHLFGFFSAFNPDVVKSVELYKSNIPAKYGGRISSVLEVNTREGNKKKFVASGGIGLITTRLALEGPFKNEKTSFIIAGRTTYSNWVLSQLKNAAYKNARASFYDGNLNINHQINEKNDLFLTGYLSKDEFKFNTDTIYKYKNQNLTFKWKYVYNNKLYSVLTTNYSAYSYSITSEANPVNAYKLSYGIKQYNIKGDFSYFLNPKHTLDFGISSLFYDLKPGSYLPLQSSKVIPDVLQKEHALESAVYLSDKYEVSQRISVNAGIRFSLYNFLGPKSINTYGESMSRSVYNILDTLQYKGGKVIKTEGGPEIRLSARYMMSDNASVKISYNTNRQYIHMLSNTTAISPTDVWKLSDPYIKPTLGDQWSLGLYKNIRSNSIETSVEGYYKNIKNFLDYKGGAVLIQNHHIETDILNTKGKAYGVELMVKKVTGKINGWVTYSYSRTFLKTDAPAYESLVNEGNWYPANYDKPHDFSFIGNYKFTHRFNTSINFIYSTGRPITLPLAQYELANASRVLYGNRNQYRIPDYIRMDLSVNIEGNHKVKKLAHSSWTIAIYNLLSRRNAYSIYFVTENGKINGYKLSIFGQAIPTVTYNFRF